MYYMSIFKVKYQMYFHTFNKTVEEKLEIANGTSFFDGEMNRVVFSEKDACDYVKSTHKTGNVGKLFKVPKEVFDSQRHDVGATSLKILSCWII